MNSEATKQATSFRKKVADIKNIPGTRISTHNAQLLTSIGLSTLDFFIGGGLPIGTLCLIEEDPHDIASKTLMKYFLSEGIIQNHKVFLSSGGKTPSKLLLKELPAAKNIDLKREIKETLSTTDEVMKIATQYQNQPPIQDPHFKVSYHNQGFDLSKYMSEEMLQQCHITVLDPTEKCDKADIIPNFIACPYSHILEKIKSQIISEGLKIPSKICQTVMRIGISSLGSPLWCRYEDDDFEELQLVRFLYLLKSLLRTSYAVVLVTVPALLVKQNKTLISRIRQTCDMVVSLESFEGSHFANHPAFQEYAGLVHLTKLPVLNSCIYPNKLSDLAYKIKRKELIIERLHLPPDFEDATEHISGCGGLSSKLDF